MSDNCPAKTAQPLTMALLQELVEPRNLNVGVKLFDDRKLANLSRAGNRLYGEVAGSGAAPYKITVDLAAGQPGLEKVKCTCPAARFQGQKVCKHGAAVLVAWATAPGAFVEVAVETLAGPPRKARGKGRAPRRGKVDKTKQIQKGLAAVEALLAELANAGLSTLTRERVDQVRTQARNLRALGLRRMAPVCLDLADSLEKCHKARSRKAPGEYTKRLADLTFHLRGLTSLVGREDTQAEDYRRLADELLGRTWSAKQLTSVSGLKLLDIYYGRKKTSDDFLIQESLFVEVNTGELHCEKLILPPHIARRKPPKPDHGRKLLEVLSAGLYPGYSPRRLKLAPEDYTGREVTPADIETLLPLVPDTVERFYLNYQDHARDIFAPEPYLGLFRPAKVVVKKTRTQLVDHRDQAMSMSLSANNVEVLENAIESGPLQVVFGAVTVSSVGLRLNPMAFINSDKHGARVTAMPGVDRYL